MLDWTVVVALAPYMSMATLQIQHLLTGFPLVLQPPFPLMYTGTKMHRLQNQNQLRLMNVGHTKCSDNRMIHKNS